MTATPLHPQPSSLARALRAGIERDARRYAARQARYAHDDLAVVTVLEAAALYGRALVAHSPLHDTTAWTAYSDCAVAYLGEETWLYYRPAGLTAGTCGADGTLLAPCPCGGIRVTAGIDTERALARALADTQDPTAVCDGTCNPPTATDPVLCPVCGVRHHARDGRAYCSLDCLADALGDASAAPVLWRTTSPFFNDDSLYSSAQEARARAEQQLPAATEQFTPTGPGRLRWIDDASRFRLQENAGGEWVGLITNVSLAPITLTGTTPLGTGHWRLGPTPPEAMTTEELRHAVALLRESAEMGELHAAEAAAARKAWDRAQDDRSSTHSPGCFGSLDYERCRDCVDADL